jgi:hypothetical protein
MTENAKRLTVFAAVVHNAIDSAINLQTVLDTELERINNAIDLFSEGKLSPGHFRAALAYRDYLQRYQLFTETISSVDTNYFLESDYHFELPHESED